MGVRRMTNWVNKMSARASFKSGMSHEWNKFSGQGSPLILNWYLSTPLNNHKRTSIIQHNWQPSINNTVGWKKVKGWVEAGKGVPAFLESCWRNNIHRDGIELPRSLGWKAAPPAHQMSCLATEVGNMPLFYFPDRSKYFNGSPIKLVWAGNVWSSSGCSSGWTEYRWYFRSLKARRERYAVNQDWDTPEKTYGDSGRCTLGGLAELHIRVIKITAVFILWFCFGFFFLISINNYSLLSKVYDDWNCTGNDKGN